MESLRRRMESHLCLSELLQALAAVADARGDLADGPASIRAVLIYICIDIAINKQKDKYLNN